MEKLTAAQQQQVKKMSDETLRIKLIGAGYEEEHVLSLECEALLATYAEHLLAVNRGQDLQDTILPLSGSGWPLKEKNWKLNDSLRKRSGKLNRKKGDVKKKLSRMKRYGENF